MMIGQYRRYSHGTGKVHGEELNRRFGKKIPNLRKEAPVASADGGAIVEPRNFPCGIWLRNSRLKPVHGQSYLTTIRWNDEIN